MSSDSSFDSDDYEFVASAGTTSNLASLFGAAMTIPEDVSLSYKAPVQPVMAKPKPLAKAEPKPPAKAEPKPPAKAEPKPPVKAEPKPPSKAEPNPPAKAEPKPPAKAEPKPSAKAEPKSSAKAEPKSSAKVEPKLPVKAQPKKPAKVKKLPKRPCWLHENDRSFEPVEPELLFAATGRVLTSPDENTPWTNHGKAGIAIIANIQDSTQLILYRTQTDLILQADLKTLCIKTSEYDRYTFVTNGLNFVLYCYEHYDFEDAIKEAGCKFMELRESRLKRRRRLAEEAAKEEAEAKAEAAAEAEAEGEAEPEPTKVEAEPSPEAGPSEAAALKQSLDGLHAKVDVLLASERDPCKDCTMCRFVHEYERQLDGNDAELDFRTFIYRIMHKELWQNEMLTREKYELKSDGKGWKLLDKILKRALTKFIQEQVDIAQRKECYGGAAISGKIL